MARKAQYQEFSEDKDGQLKAFPDTVGTGLHTDPSNAKFRRNTIKRIVQENPRFPGSDKPLSRSLNTSNIPLQHLHDVASLGTMAFVTNLGDADIGGMYAPSEYTHNQDPAKPMPHRIAINTGNEKSRFVVSHEFGHSYHDFLSRQFGSKNIGTYVAPITAATDDEYERERASRGSIGVIEGVADGYADKFSNMKRTTGKGYNAGIINVGGFSAYGPYSRNRSKTRETGFVPYLLDDRTVEPRGTSAPEAEQGRLF